MTRIVPLAVLVLLIFTAYTGARDGAFQSVYALLRNVIAFLFAMTFCQPAARAACRAFEATYPAYDYFVLAAFILIFGIVLALVRWFKLRYMEPGVEAPPWVDIPVGGVVGLLNGVVLTGVALIALSLMPFAKYVPGDQARVQIRTPALDTGATMLRFYARAADKMRGPDPKDAFLLNDEPIEHDVNGNGRADWDDSYRDLNRNGQWDRGWLWRYHHYADIGPADLAPLRLPTNLDQFGNEVQELLGAP